MAQHVCAVDVGTRSARAGFFDGAGRLIAREVVAFPLFRDGTSVGEYASAQIWRAVCKAVRAARAASGLAGAEIAGLAFDATCSLVLTDVTGAPLALGPEGRDTIAWFDHRAIAEAQDCTDTGHRLIGRHGGAMSPEMQAPKLMWLKRERPELWRRLGRAEDLTDHLAAKATGGGVRSGCTLTAKWPYAPDLGGWQGDFLEAVGLEDLGARAALPDTGAAPGSVAGPLAGVAASDLGLPAGIPVAVGLVDAFAGALACRGFAAGAGAEDALALITGTSNCVMSTGDTPIRSRGIWGPLRDAILPGSWTSEGGQSAAGAVLDHVLHGWAGQTGSGTPDHFTVLERIETLLSQHGPGFARGLHVLPDFNGNRSPLSDPTPGGMIVGLSLDRSLDGLCALYWRTAVGLACGVRQIVEQFRAAGHPAPALAMAGGLTRSPLLTRLFTDLTGTPLLQPDAPDIVLLGTAMAAAAGAGLYPDLEAASRAMSPAATRLEPDPARTGLYERDYRVFLMMQQQRADLRAASDA